MMQTTAGEVDNNMDSWKVLEMFTIPIIDRDDGKQKMKGHQMMINE